MGTTAGRVLSREAAGKQSGSQQGMPARGQARPTYQLQIRPALTAAQNVVTASRAIAPADLLTLQRTVGNRAVQRLLAMRANQAGPRDANGVAAGADRAVDRAGSSSGQPLPEALRTSFETTTGADMSRVRVHSDSASAEAAHAVGAKAYTVGQDIYFGNGQYAPNEAAGAHLLAHEVAHTLQNRGPGERLNKLEVSNPGDAAEIEADRVADVMLWGASLGPGEGQNTVYRQTISPPAPQLGGQQAAPQSGMPGAPMPQTPTPQQSQPSIGPAAPPLAPPGLTPPRPMAQGVPGGTIWFNPTAWSEINGQVGPWSPFASDQTLTVGQVTNGDQGYIKISIVAGWDFGNPDAGLKPATGTATLVFSTPFRVPQDTKKDDDKVKFSKTRPFLQFSAGSGAVLDKSPSTSEDPDIQGGSVTVAPSITYQIQTAHAVQVSPTVTVMFLSLGVADQQQVATNETVSLLKSYTAGVMYNENKPTPPAPPPTPPNQNKVLKLFHQSVDFDINQTQPQDGQLGLLQEWWDGGPRGTRPLPTPDAKQAVTSGQTEVSVVGHASKTGSREYNLVLAKNRADSVAEFVRGPQPQQMGPGAHLNVSSAGFDDATVKGEAQSERYVAVFFEALVPEDTPPVASAANEPSQAPAPVVG